MRAQRWQKSDGFTFNGGTGNSPKPQTSWRTNIHEYCKSKVHKNKANHDRSNLKAFSTTNKRNNRCVTTMAGFQTSILNLNSTLSIARLGNMSEINIMTSTASFPSWYTHRYMENVNYIENNQTDDKTSRLKVKLFSCSGVEIDFVIKVWICQLI